MTRHLILIIVTAWAGGIAGSASAFAKEDIVDGVVAKVNDRIITLSEVREVVQPVEAQLRRDYQGAALVQRLREAQIDAMKVLVDRILIVDEFNTKGYQIPDRVFEQQLEETIANEFKGDRTALIKTLEAQNMTMSQYKEQLRERVIIQAMRNSKSESQVVVSPYQMEKYYKDNIDKFKVADHVKLRMIYVKQSAVEAGQPDPRRTLADEIHAKLQAGEKFDALAREYSEGKGAKDGGDWGWISKGELLSTLDEVAFSLGAGKHSGVIAAAEGYYILLVDEVKPAHTRPLTDVRDEIERTIQRDIRTRTMEDWLRKLRTDAFVRYLAY